MNNEPFRFDTALKKFTQTVIWGYQIIAVGVFVASLWLGATWIRRPFIGAFLEQTMALNDTDTTASGKRWALYAQGFDIGDQLVSINGQPVSSDGDLERALRSFAVGDT